MFWSASLAAFFLLSISKWVRNCDGEAWKCLIFGSAKDCSEFLQLHGLEVLISRPLVASESVGFLSRTQRLFLGRRGVTH